MKKDVLTNNEAPFVRRLRYIGSWYEADPILLARIFHHSRDEEVAKVDGTRQTSILTQGCMGTYCPSQNTSLTQDPSAFPASAVERDEISELT